MANPPPGRAAVHRSGPSPYATRLVPTIEIFNGLKVGRCFQDARPSHRTAYSRSLKVQVASLVLVSTLARIVLSDGEVRATVLCPRRLIMSRIEWDLLSIADGINSVGSHSQRGEGAFNRSSTLSSKSKVVFNRSALVGVPLDCNAESGLLLQDSGVRLEICASLVIKGIGIKSEMDVVEHAFAFS